MSSGSCWNLSIIVISERLLIGTSNLKMSSSTRMIKSSSLISDFLSDVVIMTKDQSFVELLFTWHQR